MEPTITACFVVYNEERRLPAAIASIRPYVDEVVVTVQQSTDQTLAIARALADRVIEHPHYGHAGPSRLPTYEAASGLWVLSLDADEELTPYGKAHLREWAADYERTHMFRLRELTEVDGVILEDSPHSRLFQLPRLTSPVWGLHKEGFTLAEYTRVIDEEIVISHIKTTEEQERDNERYKGLMSPEEYDKIAAGRKIIGQNA
jgi:glycosyltransferase involved in cell wall biosynthesis